MAKKTTMINYIAFGDSVVVAPETVDKTEGGILIPEASQKQNEFTKVIAVGKEVKEIEVGDMVAFVHYANPSSFPLDGKRYFSFHEHEVIGKLFNQVPKELAN